MNSIIYYDGDISELYIDKEKEFDEELKLHNLDTEKVAFINAKYGFSACYDKVKLLLQDKDKILVTNALSIMVSDEILKLVNNNEINNIYVLNKDIKLQQNGENNNE